MTETNIDTINNEDDVSIGFEDKDISLHEVESTEDVKKFDLEESTTDETLSDTTNSQEDTEIQNKPLTIAQQISNIINTGKIVNGKFIPADKNIDKVLLFAAQQEINKRQTQSKVTKMSKLNKKLEGEKQLLLNKINQSTNFELTEQEKEELEDLKLSDPDKWYEKKRELENKAKNKSLSDLKEELAKAEYTMSEEEKKVELAARKKLLSAFAEANPGFPTNYTVLINEIPPRLTDKLNKGEIDFSSYLTEAYNYLSKRVVKSPQKVLNQVNLSHIHGTSQQSGAPNKEVEYGKVIL